MLARTVGCLLVLLPLAHGQRRPVMPEPVPPERTPSPVVEVALRVVVDPSTAAREPLQSPPRTVELSWGEGLGRMVQLDADGRWRGSIRLTDEEATAVPSVTARLVEPGWQQVETQSELDRHLASGRSISMILHARPGHSFRARVVDEHDQPVRAELRAVELDAHGRVRRYLPCWGILAQDRSRISPMRVDVSIVHVDACVTPDRIALRAVSGSSGASRVMVATTEEVIPLRLGGRGKLSGRIVSENGRPLNAAHVRFVCDDPHLGMLGGVSSDAGRRAGCTRTDEGGSFKVSGLAPGAYHLWVRPGNGEPNWAVPLPGRVHADGTARTLVLERRSDPTPPSRSQALEARGTTTLRLQVDPHLGPTDPPPLQAAVRIDEGAWYVPSTTTSDSWVDLEIPFGSVEVVLRHRESHMDCLGGLRNRSHWTSPPSTIELQRNSEHTIRVGLVPAGWITVEL